MKILGFLGPNSFEELTKAMANLQTDRQITWEPDPGEELLVNFLVVGLLNGRIRMPIFDRMKAYHISDDVRLIGCYRRSSSESLTAFLELGRVRRKIRQYGPGTENQLRKNLTEYIKSVGIHDIKIARYGMVEVSKNLISPSDIEFEEILHAVLKSSSPEWFLSDSIWRQWLLRLKNRNHTGECINRLCQEIGASWPRKPGWEKKTVEDFCSHSFSELSNAKRFRKVTLRSLIKAIAYLQTDRQITQETQAEEDESENSLVDGLLDGRLRIPNFDQMSAYHISDDVRLINCYRRSSSESLTAFLELGQVRRKIRQYGPGTENQLRKNLTEYVKSVGIHNIEILDHGIIETPKSVLSFSAIESEERLSEVINSPTPEWFLNNSVWRQWLLRIKERNLGWVCIYDLCQKIGAMWPKASGWNKKTVDDFSSYSFSELFDTKYFRNVKYLRSLIKAIAYLQIDRQITPEPEAGEELLVNFLVVGLLNGRFRMPIFDRMSAYHISDDVRLINCYRRSSSESLTAFLKLGRVRLKIRHYGSTSEKKLRECLAKHIKSIGVYDIEIADYDNLEVPKSGFSPSSIEPEEILHAVIESPTPEFFLSNSIWGQWLLRINELSLGGTRMYSLCQEIGTKWPKASGWDKKTVGDFCYPSISELSNSKFLSIGNLRSLIKAIAYLQTYRRIIPKTDAGEELHINCLVDGLLNGRLRIPNFDRMSAYHISDDVRLINCYRKSSSDSLTAFLKMGRNRLIFSQYGASSEKKLRDSLTRYFKNVGIHDIEITRYGKAAVANSVISPSATASEDILHEVLNSPNPEWLMTDSIWREWLLRLSEKNLMGARIYELCQEIGAKWPITTDWDKKTIEDFCSYSFSELFDTKYFRKRKLRSLIKAIAYLQTDRQRPVRGMTPEQKLDWLRNKIPLSEREKEIYRRRSRGEILDDISHLMHLTRERIRQIHYLVVSKFRTPPRPGNMF